MIAAPILVLLAGFAGVAALMATAEKPETASDETAPLAVEIAAAQAETRALAIETQAEIRAKTHADIAARVAGQIVYVDPSLEAGAIVEEGQVLARIDPADFRLAVDRARAELSRAREALAKTRAEAKLAEDDWNELGLDTPPSDLTLYKPQVASAEADYRAAQARVAEAELDLERADIKAPFAGRVAARMVDTGDLVAVGAPVAAVFSVDKAQARAALSDTDMAVLGVGPGFVASEERPGPRATVSAVVAGVRKEWEGALVSVEAAIDSRTRLATGLVEVENPFAGEIALAPGVFATITLSGAREESLAKIPRGALKKNKTVYVVLEDYTIVARDVEPAMTTARDVYIRDGLAPGERVVVSYIPTPKDGMKVRDLNAPAPAEVADAGGE